MSEGDELTNLAFSAILFGQGDPYFTTEEWSSSFNQGGNNERHKSESRGADRAA